MGADGFAGAADGSAGAVDGSYAAGALGDGDGRGCAPLRGTSRLPRRRGLPRPVGALPFVFGSAAVAALALAASATAAAAAAAAELPPLPEAGLLSDAGLTEWRTFLRSMYIFRSGLPANLTTMAEIFPAGAFEYSQRAPLRWIAGGELGALLDLPPDAVTALFANGTAAEWVAVFGFRPLPLVAALLVPVALLFVALGLLPWIFHRKTVSHRASRRAVLFSEVEAVTAVAFSRDSWEAEAQGFNHVPLTSLVVRTAKLKSMCAFWRRGGWYIVGLFALVAALASGSSSLFVRSAERQIVVPEREIYKFLWVLLEGADYDQVEYFNLTGFANRELFLQAKWIGLQPFHALVESTASVVIGDGRLLQHAANFIAQCLAIADSVLGSRQLHLESYVASVAATEARLTEQELDYPLAHVALGGSSRLENIYDELSRQRDLLASAEARDELRRLADGGWEGDSRFETPAGVAAADHDSGCGGTFSRYEKAAAKSPVFRALYGPKSTEELVAATRRLFFNQSAGIGNGWMGEIRQEDAAAAEHSSSCWREDLSDVLRPAAPRPRGRQRPRRRRRLKEVPSHESEFADAVEGWVGEAPPDGTPTFDQGEDTTASTTVAAEPDSAPSGMPADDKSITIRDGVAGAEVVPIDLDDGLRMSLTEAGDLLMQVVDLLVELRHSNVGSEIFTVVLPLLEWVVYGLNLFSMCVVLMGVWGLVLVVGALLSVRRRVLRLDRVADAWNWFFRIVAQRGEERAGAAPTLENAKRRCRLPSLAPLLGYFLIWQAFLTILLGSIFFIVSRVGTQPCLEIEDILDKGAFDKFPEVVAMLVDIANLSPFFVQDTYQAKDTVVQTLHTSVTYAGTGDIRLVRTFFDLTPSAKTMAAVLETLDGVVDNIEEACGDVTIWDLWRELLGLAGVGIPSWDRIFATAGAGDGEGGLGDLLRANPGLLLLSAQLEDTVVPAADVAAFAERQMETAAAEGGQSAWASLAAAAAAAAAGAAGGAPPGSSAVEGNSGVPGGSGSGAGFNAADGGFLAIGFRTLQESLNEVFETLSLPIRLCLDYFNLCEEAAPEAKAQNALLLELDGGDGVREIIETVAGWGVGGWLTDIARVGDAAVGALKTQPFVAVSCGTDIGGAGDSSAGEGGVATVGSGRSADLFFAAQRIDADTAGPGSSPVKAAARVAAAGAPAQPLAPTRPPARAPAAVRFAEIAALAAAAAAGTARSSFTVGLNPSSVRRMQAPLTIFERLDRRARGKDVRGVSGAPGGDLQFLQNILPREKHTAMAQLSAESFAAGAGDLMHAYSGTAAPAGASSTPELEKTLQFKKQKPRSGQTDTAGGRKQGSLVESPQDDVVSVAENLKDGAAEIAERAFFHRVFAKAAALPKSADALGETQAPRVEARGPLQNGVDALEGSSKEEGGAPGNSPFGVELGGEGWLNILLTLITIELIPSLRRAVHAIPEQVTYSIASVSTKVDGAVDILAGVVKSLVMEIIGILDPVCYGVFPDFYMLALALWVMGVAYLVCATVVLRTWNAVLAEEIRLRRLEVSWKATRALKARFEQDEQEQLAQEFSLLRRKAASNRRQAPRAAAQTTAGPGPTARRSSLNRQSARASLRYGALPTTPDAGFVGGRDPYADAPASEDHIPWWRRVVFGRPPWRRRSDGDPPPPIIVQHSTSSDGNSHSGLLA